MSDILLTTISLILGGLIGFITSNYFYKKTQPFEHDMRRLSNSLEQIYLQSKFPTIFDPTAFVKDYSSQAPKNTDIPHLWTIRCEKNSVHPGEKLFIFFRARDMGVNLSSINGTEVRNNLNQYNVPVVNEGFGWQSATAQIPHDAPTGVYKLQFTMKDSKNNIGNGEFEYVVIAP
jgi:hypothetical protein